MSDDGYDYDDEYDDEYYELYGEDIEVCDGFLHAPSPSSSPKSAHLLLTPHS